MTASGRPRCLDLSRLVSRVGRGPWTGIDRVEAAYLDALLARPDPLWALVRVPGRYQLFDRDGTARLRDAFEAGHGVEAVRPTQQCLRPFLARMLRRRLPRGVAYLNIGHSNLTERVLTAFKALDGAQVSVLIHDMIPLDFPQYQRPGTPEKFEQAMRLVAKYADLVICNSDVTKADTQRYFESWGRVPDLMTAHLGVPLASPGEPPGDLPLDRPYFVTLSTIEPRKNHALLLDVWDEIYRSEDKSDGPVLIIIGNRGWNNDAVFARLDAHPLRERAIFERSGLSDAQVTALLSGARALLFPSFAEGYGLPPIEAAALGTPVICGKLAIYQEILGTFPVYLESNDRYSWEKAVREMATIDGGAPLTGRSERVPIQPPNWDDHFDQVLRRT